MATPLDVPEKDWAALTPEQRGLHRALLLQRYTDPKRWRAGVDAIEDPTERAVADNYLRGMVDRIRARVAAERKSHSEAS